MNWYLAVLKKYAVFSGRAQRQEYWMFVLFNILIAIVLAVIDGVIGSPGVLSGLYSLAIVIPNIAVFVRRLHDTDRSGWWVLLGLVPIIGGIVLFVFSVLEGDAGDNQYGPDPKAESA